MEKMNEYLDFIASEQCRVKTRSCEAELGRGAQGVTSGRITPEMTPGGKSLQAIMERTELDLRDREFLRLALEKKFIREASGDIKVSISSDAGLLRFATHWFPAINANPGLSTVNDVPKQNIGIALEQGQWSQVRMYFDLSQPRQTESLMTVHQAIKQVVRKVGGDRLEGFEQRGVDVQNRLALGAQKALDYENRERFLGWRMRVPWIAVEKFFERVRIRKELREAEKMRHQHENRDAPRLYKELTKPAIIEKMKGELQVLVAKNRIMESPLLHNGKKLEQEIKASVDQILRETYAPRQNQYKIRQKL